jgi:hypothetical protein
MSHFCGVPMTAASIVVCTLCRDYSLRIRPMLAILEHAMIGDALSHSSQLIQSCVCSRRFSGAREFQDLITALDSWQIDPTHADFFIVASFGMQICEQSQRYDTCVDRHKQHVG